ncbi:MAG: hypothetical protein ACXVQ3_03715 [Gaiellaceae bacterium]
MRRRDREQVKPLIDDTFETIDLGIRVLCQSVAIDYVQSHRTRKPLPKGAGALLQLWLDEQANEDAQRRITEPDWPYPMPAIFEFAESTIRQIEENRHDLVGLGMVELVRSAKGYQTGLYFVRLQADVELVPPPSFIGAVDPGVESRRIDEAKGRARAGAIQATRTFIDVYEDVAQRGTIEVSSGMLKAADGFAPPVDDS